MKCRPFIRQVIIFFFNWFILLRQDNNHALFFVSVTVDCSVRDCFNAENIIIDVAGIDSLIVDGSESIDIDITSLQTYTCMSTLCKECDSLGDLLTYFCSNVDEPILKNSNIIKLPVNGYRCLETLFTDNNFIKAVERNNATFVNYAVLTKYEDCFLNSTNMNMIQTFQVLKDTFSTADNLNKKVERKRRKQDRARKR